MSAVSLSEAWNDPPPQAESMPPPVEHTNVHVSARPAKATVPEPDEKTEPVDTVPNSPPTPAIVFPYEEMLEEFRALRREESRRCTVYLAIGGILFAILFMYIDRLQSQVRMLNTFLIHRQMPTLAAVAQARPHMSPRLQAPW